MATYLIRRFVQGFVVLVLASFTIYSLLLITPGGPMDQVRSFQQNPDVTVSQEYIDQLLESYNLDIPWPLNYLVWLFDPEETTTVDENYNIVPKGIDVNIFGRRIQGSGVVTGDFGTSLQLQKGSPVMKMMGDRLGNTLLLTTTALLVSLIIAFPIGIISAIRQYSRLDYAVTAFSFVGIAMPVFWLGLMLIIFLAVIPKQLNQNGMEWMPYLPPGNIADPGMDQNLINRMYHLVLPVITLSFIQIAGLSRYVRASMLEVMRQDYVRTAWAKGLSQRGVILKHALRNALIPLITIIMLSLPGLFSGAIITETVFAYAGMGQLYFLAVSTLDINLIMGFLMIITSLIILSNIFADVLYALVDPRIRFS